MTTTVARPASTHNGPDVMGPQTNTRPTGSGFPGYHDLP